MVGTRTGMERGWSGDGSKLTRGNRNEGRSCLDRNQKYANNDVEVHLKPMFPIISGIFWIFLSLRQRSHVSLLLYCHSVLNSYLSLSSGQCATRSRIDHPTSQYTQPRPPYLTIQAHISSHPSADHSTM